MLIRDFDDSDVTPANALTNHFILHTAVHWGTVPATDAEFRDYWLKGRARHPWLTCMLDGSFAGYAKASPWRDREAYRLTAETTVYISLDMHRRGIGKALMVALLDRLRADGFHQAVAGIALPNDASVALHEALGFAKVGVFTQVGRKQNRWLDAGFWQRSLT